jgi:hypothetical protein
MTSFSRRSGEHFRIAAEHAAWCRDQGLLPREVLATIGVSYPEFAGHPGWTDVHEELARAHCRLTGERGAAM